MNEILIWRGEYQSPTVKKGNMTLEALLPVATTMDLTTRLAVMTGGRAVVTTRFAGYRPCSLELGATCPRRSVHPLDTAKYILAMRNALDGALTDE